MSALVATGSMVGMPQSINAASYTQKTITPKDVTLKNPTFGYKDYSKSGLAWAKAGVSPGWASVKVGATGLGNSSAWAFIASKYKYDGKQSEPAYINFKGSYKVEGNPGLVCGNISHKIYVSIHDLTDKSEVTGITVSEQSDESGVMGKYNGKVNHSCLVYLQAGHTYLFKLGIEANASDYGPQIVNEFGDIYLNSVSVKFVK